MMKEKVCLVTGGTSGVGRSVAAGCAREGATVVIVGSDQTRADAAAHVMREATGNRQIEALQADLSAMDSVRALAEKFKTRYDQIHVLSLNAATLTLNRRTTADGYESMFATNYLSHFFITNLLLDLLRRSAPSRVIAVSGLPGSLVRVQLDMDDLMLKNRFSALKATARAALAKALFIFELARRTEGSGVTANTFHPGLVRSGLPNRLPWYLKLPAQVAMTLFPTESDTGVFLATSPEVEGLTGRIFVGRKPADFRPAYDAEDVAARLWESSARLVGIA
jgi:NAD(P)-dependent dehydrogenase (short-subunit alcohol dehydrogenase family)